VLESDTLLIQRPALDALAARAAVGGAKVGAAPATDGSPA
jgi:hypothetical protein